MSDKHLGADSELPPLKKDTLRIYSMRFCPMAQRTILALGVKGIEHEVVNVNLKKKPSWFIERNPKGLVPILEINDQIVYESVVCCEYLDEVYPGDQLVAETPYQRAQDKILIDFFSGKIVPLMMSRKEVTGLEEEKKNDFFQHLDRMENELKERKSVYFRGEKPGLVDIIIWPFFERIEGMNVLGGDSLPGNRFPLLTSWMSQMMEVPAVKNHHVSPEQFRRFYKHYNSPNPLIDEILL
ncbi:glutathione S-transferase omega-1-like isoform X2 [Saccoglossus kowalevskii]|uniref:Glutathione S-transferase omega n=1 Tax=Saccoglossus kowalevskii TaxID=10224 RepID=A0ABM0GVX6_SACKO|nr:PREDICTED: glutathione S-transferase omega-1-like [Saccoglossus kowalevskii]